MLEYMTKLPKAKPWPLPNVWGMVTAANQEQAGKRVPILLRTPFAVRGVSVEPMLGMVNLQRVEEDENGSIDALHGAMFCEGRNEPAETGKLDWVICGGESGPGSRFFAPRWPRELRDQCVAAGVPFMFKQWGGRKPKKAGRTLDGRIWDQYPEQRAQT